MKAILGFSGGIDSAMAAHFLREEGYQVLPVTFVFSAENRAETLLHARKAARILGLDTPVIVDKTDLFRAKVIDSFLCFYKQGMTPNPCVSCNEQVKFKALFEMAAKLRCETVATGHYARIGGVNRGSLLRGIDPKKDQSYMLYRLHSRLYGKIRFPLGCRTKEEVKESAGELFPPLNETTTESSDLCFLSKGQLPYFLEKNVKDRPGGIYSTDGEYLGSHQGLSRYTIGQRQGLGLPGGPWFVTAKDSRANRLVVGRRKDLAVNVIECFDSVFHEDLHAGQIVSMRHRYRASFVNSEILAVSHGKFRLFCLEPAYGVAPGQSVVLYSGERTLGGGIIEKTYWRRPSHDANTPLTESRGSS
ncbi:MAG: tRNA 2-thiouridine(34) synthase MnmA [Thermovirgaceae bacterium]